MVAALAALLMAFARVYVGAHWPGDVEIGLALGAAVTVGGFKVIERPAVALVGFLVTTPLRPLLVARGTLGRGTTGSLPDQERVA